MISDGGMERRQSWEGGTEGCMTAIDERRRDKMLEKKKKKAGPAFFPLHHTLGYCTLAELFFSGAVHYLWGIKKSMLLHLGVS